MEGRWRRRDSEDPPHRVWNILSGGKCDHPIRGTPPRLRPSRNDHRQHLLHRSLGVVDFFDHIYLDGSINFSEVLCFEQNFGSS